MQEQAYDPAVLGRWGSCRAAWPRSWQGWHISFCHPLTSVLPNLGTQTQLFGYQRFFLPQNCSSPVPLTRSSPLLFLFFTVCKKTAKQVSSGLRQELTISRAIGSTEIFIKSKLRERLQSSWSPECRRALHTAGVGLVSKRMVLPRNKALP